MAAGTNGDVYVTGSSGTDNFVTTKLASPTNIWTTSYNNNGQGGTISYVVRRDAADNPFVAGTFISFVDQFGTHWGMVLIKYNSSGLELWHTNMYGFLGSGIPTPLSLAVDQAQNSYICGNYNNTYGPVFYVGKFDSSGQKRWTWLMDQDAGTLFVAGESRMWAMMAMLI